MKKSNQELITFIAIAYAFLLMAIFLSSCSPSAKLRRANKLIEKSGLEWHSDTLYTTLEIPIPEIVKDTIFQSQPGDTVRIQEDRLKIEYVQIPGGKVYIKGECQADTIYKEVIKTINKEIVCPPKEKGWTFKQILIAVFIGLAALVTGAILTKLFT